MGVALEIFCNGCGRCCMQFAQVQGCGQCLNNCDGFGNACKICCKSCEGGCCGDVDDDGVTRPVAGSSTAGTGPQRNLSAAQLAIAKAKAKQAILSK